MRTCRPGPWRRVHGARGLLGAVAVALIAGCAMEPLPSATETPPLPAGMVVAQDLRGAYRAALCMRDDMTEAQCGDTLYRFGGEPPSPRPPAADPARFRLLFVPGFLASCFPDIHTFGDVVEAARKQGFATQVLDVEGRNGTAANARMLADQIERVPDDGRRIIVIGHSKGAVDVLDLAVRRPDLATRIAAVLTVAGALQGSPLADHLHGLYGITFGAFPFSSCSKGDGDAVLDLQRDGRREWWAQHGMQIRVPVYSIVGIPGLDRVSPSLYAAFAGLWHVSRYNDGMLLVPDQVASSVRLLGIVNADHLTVGIPPPEHLPWSLFFTATPFPRPQVVLAAVDVIAMEIASAPPAPARAR